MKNFPQCQYETCFRMAFFRTAHNGNLKHVSEWYATHAHKRMCLHTHNDCEISLTSLPGCHCQQVVQTISILSFERGGLYLWETHFPFTLCTVLPLASIEPKFACIVAYTLLDTALIVPEDLPANSRPCKENTK